MTIRGTTHLLGLLGWPVSHSFSPAMHNAAAAALHLDLVYVPLPVQPADLATAVRGLSALGFQGVNVTVPHKQAVMSLLDEIDPAARTIGAVNTIQFLPTAPNHQQVRGIRLIGFNTDWTGFLADLTNLQQTVAGRHCLILGAGGSARAIAYALLTAGAHVSIFARRPQQAHQLLHDLVRTADISRPPSPISTTNLSAHAWDDLPSTVSSYNDFPNRSAPLIINTTPLGMTPHPDTSPWPDHLPLPADAFVYDLVYNPAETKLMQQAKAADCQAINGLGMLLHQGAEAFYLWTGQRPDIAVMAAALRT